MPVLTAIFLLFFFSASGKQQLHLVHDQGQKSKHKRYNEDFTLSDFITIPIY